MSKQLSVSEELHSLIFKLAGAKQSQVGRNVPTEEVLMEGCEYLQKKYNSSSDESIHDSSVE